MTGGSWVGLREDILSEVGVSRLRHQLPFQQALKHAGVHAALLEPGHHVVVRHIGGYLVGLGPAAANVDQGGDKFGNVLSSEAALPFFPLLADEIGHLDKDLVMLVDHIAEIPVGDGDVPNIERVALEQNLRCLAPVFRVGMCLTQPKIKQ